MYLVCDVLSISLLVLGTDSDLFSLRLGVTVSQFSGKGAEETIPVKW